MQSNFPIWYRRAVIYELGNDNNPKDPGGRTSDGITQKEYDVFRDHKGKPRRDVWAVGTGCKAGDPEALAEREEIFKSYWDRINGDKLPGGVDYVVADGSLNSGPAQSIKWLQRALNLNIVDGEIGPATIAAANAAGDDDALVDDICQRRLAFMHGLHTWSEFGKGWGARVANVRRMGEALATGSIPGDPVLLRVIGGAAKASPLSVKQPIISVTSAQIATGATTVSTTVTAIATQGQTITDTLPDHLKTIVLSVLGGLTVASFAASAIATIAKARADATHSGTATATIDTEADNIATTVAVNDNTPPPSAGEKAAA